MNSKIIFPVPGGGSHKKRFSIWKLKTGYKKIFRQIGILHNTAYDDKKTGAFYRKKSVESSDPPAKTLVNGQTTIYLESDKKLYKMEDRPLLYVYLFIESESVKF